MAGVSAFAGLGPALEAHLPGFLVRQRWFAGKGHVIESATLEDSVALERVAPCVLAFVRVGYAGGASERYALLLAAEDGADPALRIAGASAWDGAEDLIEASTLPAYGRALLAGFFEDGARIESGAGGALVYGDTRGAIPFGRVAPEALAVKPLGAEQSNTSLRAGEGHVFKLFRRIEPGENPEVEIGRFFAEHTRFDALAVLDGSLSLVRDGAPRTVGVLQRFVRHRADGWRWMLQRLAAWRAGEAGAAELTDEARRLGTLTADMHLALASGRGVQGFDPRPAAAADLDSWRGSFEARRARLAEDLRRHLATVPPPAVADAIAVLEGNDVLAGLAPDPDEAAAAGVELIRLHGDYHLGQTLRTDDGYVVMDFEGEPSRPLAERRAPGCALRDVAGMLRSFDYAEATVAAGAGAGAAPGTTPLRETFLAAWLERVAGGSAALVPAHADVARRWAAFFEMDKALYEIEYELHHRPDWIWIPLRGARQLIEANSF